MRSLHLSDADATSGFARALAPRLGPGDILLLAGPIGAGKTHFARSLIQTLLPVPEDVPSPTFTLVQSYEGPGFDIWHADLYRLTHPDEVVELGLEEAFDTALCLIEWPERLGPYSPQKALTLQFLPQDDGSRRLLLSAGHPRWAPLLAEDADV